MATDWSHAFPAAEPPTPGTPAWYVREKKCDRGRWQIRCVVDATHDDAAVVVGPIATHGAYEPWRADVDSNGRSVIGLNPVGLVGTPPIWFVVLPELDIPTPAMSLVGFASDHVAEGTVLTDPEFFSLPVPSNAQVGAIRWWHLEGIVDQVFIPENWRQRRLGTAMTYAANAFQVHNGWPGNLRSDSRRTELGKYLDAGTQFPNRFAPIEEVSPPMDPPKGN
jgi:hypothetical protein